MSNPVDHPGLMSYYSTNYQPRSLYDSNTRLLTQQFLKDPHDKTSEQNQVANSKPGF